MPETEELSFDDEMDSSDKNILIVEESVPDEDYPLDEASTSTQKVARRRTNSKGKNLPWKCQHCSRSYQHKRSLRKHQRYLCVFKTPDIIKEPVQYPQRNGKPVFFKSWMPGRFQCAQCGRVYRYERTLKHHKCDDPQPKFQCKHCDFKTSSKRSLFFHISKSHSELF